MNGIELLQLIKEGRVKDDTFIDVYYDDEELGKTLISELHYIANKCLWKGGTFNLSYLYNDSYGFQIVEEEKDIEEIPYHYSFGYIDCGGLSDVARDELDKNFNYFKDKINELINAVNKLKKEGK